MTSKQSSSLPNERHFGLLFAAVFAVLLGYGWMIKGWPALLLWVLAGTASAFAVAAFVAPKLLAPLNWLWFQLGQLLGKIVSPIVLGVIYFLILTPVSVVTRFFGRDQLRLKRKSSQTSYWLERSPPGPEPESFKNQF